MPKLTFAGAAGTVTGSKYLLSAGGENLLIDYGMFQGDAATRRLNYDVSPVDPGKIQWLVLTHAHIDHSGLIPRLVKQGFRGRIICTPPTRDVVELLLFDSANLQAEDRVHHEKKGCTGCDHTEPLFTEDDVKRTLPLMTTHPYGEWVELSGTFSIRFTNVGHILGSGMVEVKVKESGREVKLLFSGDVGRYGMPLNPDPDRPPEADYLIVESTYGDRRHPEGDVFSQLEAVGRRTIAQGGILLVPAFAVGRAQQLLLIFQELFMTGRLPKFPLHLDSPMAVDTTKIYAKYPELLKADVVTDGGAGRILYGPQVSLHRSVEESKALNNIAGPAVIMASSGMLTGGRILHHLIARLPSEKNILMLSGYQAAGSLGQLIQSGAREVQIHHESVQIRASVVDMQALSAHADYAELLKWLEPIASPPKLTCITHGEPAASQAFARHLEESRGWKTFLPARGNTVELS